MNVKRLRRTVHPASLTEQFPGLLRLVLCSAFLRCRDLARTAITSRFFGGKARPHSDSTLVGDGVVAADCVGGHFGQRAGLSRVEAAIRVRLCCLLDARKVTFNMISIGI